MGKDKDVLDLINQQASQVGTFTMGSVSYEDRGAYHAPQSIKRHGLVRRAEPPLFNTGHDTQLVDVRRRYSDGRVVEMPGLPAFERGKLPVVSED